MKRVDQAFSTIERRFSQHNSRMNREIGGGGGLSVAARRSGTAGAGRVPLGVQFGPNRAQLEKAAGAAQHRQIMGQIRAEERARVAAARAATRAEKERLAAMRKGFVEMSKAAQAADRQERRVAASGKRSFARGTMGALGGAAGTIAGIGKAGLALTGISGGAAAGIAISTEMRERAKASQLANQAGNTALKGQLLQDARGVRGFTGEEALGGMEAFVTKTGDLEMARKIIGDLGTLSLATGANLDDLGETAGQAFNVLRDQIKDPKQQLIELNGIMTALAQQGNMGAVEIKDLARDFGKLGAATRGFEGGAPALLRTMGAFAQMAVARGGAEGSADASTASARLVGDIVTNKKKFKKLGVGIKSDVDPTKLRNPLAIMQDVLAKTGGDVEKTSGLFGIESAKIFKGLSAVYSEAEKSKKGSGRGAVDAEFKRFAGATLDPKALKDRAASRLSDPDVQFKETMKGLNAALAKELLPVAIELGTKLKEATPAIGAFAKKVSEVVMWLAANPWKGIGALVAGSIAKEIAASQIKSLIEKAIMGGRVPVPGGGGGPTVVPGGAPKGSSLVGTATGVGMAYLGAQGVAAGANAVRDEVGMKRSAAGLMHGFDEKGEFSFGQMVKDTFNPLSMFNKAAGLGGEVARKMTGAQDLQVGTGNIGRGVVAAKHAAGITAADLANTTLNVKITNPGDIGSPATPGAPTKPNRGNAPTP
jgi:hypothetical protein